MLLLLHSAKHDHAVLVGLYQVVLIQPHTSTQPELNGATELTMSDGKTVLVKETIELINQMAGAVS